MTWDLILENADFLGFNDFQSSGLRNANWIVVIFLSLNREVVLSFTLFTFVLFVSRRNGRIFK